MPEFSQTKREWIDGLSASFSEGHVRIGKQLNLSVVQIEDGSFLRANPARKKILRPRFDETHFRFSICLASCANQLKINNISDMSNKWIIIEVTMFLVEINTMNISLVRDGTQEILAVVDFDRERIDTYESDRSIFIKAIKVAGRDRLIIVSSFELTSRIVFHMNQYLPESRLMNKSSLARCEIHNVRFAVS